MGWIVVRSYILTERERQIAERYLKTGEKLETLTELLFHLKRNYPNLKSDMELIKELLKK